MSVRDTCGYSGCKKTFLRGAHWPHMLPAKGSEPVRNFCSVMCKINHEAEDGLTASEVWADGFGPGVLST